MCVCVSVCADNESQCNTPPRLTVTLELHLNMEFTLLSTSLCFS